MFYPIVSLAIVDQGQAIIFADNPVVCITIAKVYVLCFTMWYVLAYHICFHNNCQGLCFMFYHTFKQKMIRFYVLCFIQCILSTFLHYVESEACLYTTRALPGFMFYALLLRLYGEILVVYKVACKIHGHYISACFMFYR